MVEAAPEYKEVHSREEIEPQCHRPKTDLDKEGREERARRIKERALLWTPSKLTGEVRAEHASPKGGFWLEDEEQT